jgi:ribonucleotide reductase beta subunit family protein with ferritin-like domain
MPAVKAKAAWAKYWINSQMTFAERLVAMSGVEGIHFAGSFAFIFWLKDRFPGKLPGLMKSNEFISRDENIHTEFAISLFHHLPHKIPLARIKEIYLSALQREIVFQKEIMPAHGISGLATERMIEHVKYTANYWFSLFQDPKKGEPELLLRNADGSTPQPLNEVRRISRQTKVNFFEDKNANYNQPDVSQQAASLSEKF